MNARATQSSVCLLPATPVGLVGESVAGASSGLGELVTQHIGTAHRIGRLACFVGVQKSCCSIPNVPTCFPSRYRMAANQPLLKPR